MNRSAALISAVLLCGACATPKPATPSPPAAPQPLPALPESNLLRELGLMAHERPALGETAVGLLLPAVSRWGRTLSTSLQPNVPGARGGPHLRLYQFHAEGAARPWSVLFACSSPCGGALWHEAFALSDAAGQPPGRTVGAGSLGPGEEVPLGLGEEAHLVQIEVNLGAGAAGVSGYFISRRPQEVMGVDVQGLLDAAQAEFKRFAQARADATGALYQEAWRRVSDSPPPQPLEDDFLAPSWDAQARQLQVIFVRRVLSHAVVTVDVRNDTPCGFPSPPARVPTPEFAAVELGQRLVLSADGALVSREDFVPALMSQGAQKDAGMPIWNFTGAQRCPYDLGAPGP